MSQNVFHYDDVGEDVAEYNELIFFSCRWRRANL